MPVYNTVQYLSSCIRSLIGQSYQNIELILVDDGSTDGSGELCEEWAHTDHRITVYHQRNGGLSCARNSGLDRMNGEYVSFVDSDDYVSKDYISYLYSLFAQSESCTITACNHYIVRNRHIQRNWNGENGCCVFTRREAMEEALYHGCIDVSAWAKMYKREVFSTLRFPVGRIFEDTWLFGDLMQTTETVVYGNQCCYFYVCRNQSLAHGDFSPVKLQYIESAQKLADDAVKISKDLSRAGIRRVNHARMSVLRNMENSGKEFKEKREELRRSVLQDAKQYLNDSRIPRRDKAGILLLRLSLKAYYKGWNAYDRYRNIRYQLGPALNEPESESEKK